MVLGQCTIKELIRFAFLFFFSFNLLPYNCFGQTNKTIAVMSAKKRSDLIDQAQQYRSKEQYKKALVCIDSILSQNPNDTQILLFKGDVFMQDQNYKGAVKALRRLVPLDYDNIMARINLSYALFKSHKPERALKEAKEAWLIDTNNSNAMINYFNAMLWNVKEKDARLFLDQHTQYLSNEQQLVLKARLYMTKGDFNRGLMFYDSLALITKNKYYILEFAEVLLARGQIKRSLETMERRKALFSDSEWNNYLLKYKAKTVERVGTELSYFKDVVKNIRQEAALLWEQGGQRNIKFGLRVGTAKFSVDGEQVSNLTYGQISSKQQWNSNWSGETEVRLQSIKSDDLRSFQTLLGSQKIKYQPHDRRMIAVSYNSEVLSFTSSLLKNNIRVHNLGAMTHLLLTARTGVYSQGGYAFIGDGNRRAQWFGSLYHLFRTEPNVKVGWNYSYLHFSNRDITTYFSPDQYLSTELFAEVQYKKPEWSNFFCNTQGALGIQQIEKQNWESAYRFEVQAGFNRRHMDLSLNYRRSNVAFNSGTGYQFDWFTFRFVYKWNL